MQDACNTQSCLFCHMWCLLVDELLHVFTWLEQLDTHALRSATVHGRKNLQRKADDIRTKTDIFAVMEMMGISTIATAAGDATTMDETTDLPTDLPTELLFAPAMAPRMLWKPSQCPPSSNSIRVPNECFDFNNKGNKRNNQLSLHTDC